VTSALLLAATLAAAPAPRLGADVTITSPTRGPVVAVLGSLRVESEVEGDAIALGGDVVIVPGARVSGDAVAVGGTVSGGGIAVGRAVAVSSLEGAALAPLGAGSSARAAWGVRAMRAGGWMVLAALLLLVFPRQVRRGAGHLRAMPVRTVAVGTLSLAVWLLVVLFLLAVAASRLGIALLLAGVAVLLAAKVLGLLAVAWLVGHALAPALPAGWRGELPRTGAGMLLLAVAGMLPVAGPLAWLLANVAGVGAIVAALVVPRLAVAVRPLSPSASS
jgi:hypothetical protein